VLNIPSPLPTDKGFYVYPSTQDIDARIAARRFAALSSENIKQTVSSMQPLVLISSTLVAVFVIVSLQDHLVFMVLILAVMFICVFFCGTLLRTSLEQKAVKVESQCNQLASEGRTAWLPDHFLAEWQRANAVIGIVLRHNDALETLWSVCADSDAYDQIVTFFRDSPYDVMRENDRDVRRAMHGLLSQLLREQKRKESFKGSSAH